MSAQGGKTPVNPQPEGISSELSLGEVISETFDLYRREFVKFVILFAIIETALGVLTALIRSAVVVPSLPAAGTPQFDSALPGYFGALVELIGLLAIITLISYPLLYGSGVKMASDEIKGEKVDIVQSVNFSLFKIPWMWAVGIVVGIIVILGFIALIVPGIILSIMFSLVIPVIIIENAGFGSMGRSRQLVGHRWGKTFVLFLIFGIIIAIAGVIVSVITGFIGGVGSTIASSILSALYLPLIPIFLAVYYYSNSVRISPPPTASFYPPPPPPGMQTWPPPASTPTPQQAQSITCPKCGALAAQDSIFCPSCGSRLRLTA